MAERSSLRFLGPARVERNGQAVGRLASGKALALLAYLVVQGQPVSRERLVDLFWRRLPPGRGRANLSWTLHKLSSLLPGCLEARRDSVCYCRADGCWLDLDAFTACLPNAMAQAAALYRGDFMQGLVVDGCPDVELWLVGERERVPRRIERGNVVPPAREVDRIPCVATSEVHRLRAWRKRMDPYHVDER